MGVIYKCDFCGYAGELNGCNCRDENFEFLEDNRNGTLIETFYHDGTVYEKVAIDDDAYEHTAMFVRSGTNQLHQIVLTVISEEEYEAKKTILDLK